MFFVTDYSEEYGQICKIVKKFLPLLEVDSKMSEILAKTDIKCVPRKAPTLGKMLAPSQVSSVPLNAVDNWLTVKGTYKCGANTCKTCQVISVGSDFKSNNTGQVFKNRGFHNCNTRNVVYLLECNHCNKQYVGRTSRTLKERIREHIRSITKKEETTPVGRHFKTCSPNGIRDLKVKVIEKVRVPNRGGDVIHRLNLREAFWILKLDTRIPNGLNFKHDISYLY